MWLEKDGIRVEFQHPADIARMKTLGYMPVIKDQPVVDLPVPEPEPEPVVLEQTPDDANAEAVEAVNASLGTPKATKGGKK
jgi:hypothetical protein